MKLFFLILSGFFLSFQSGNISTPQSIVKEYLYAIDHFDLKKANTFLIDNPENKKSSEQIKNYIGSLSESKKQQLISKAKNRKYRIVMKEVSTDSALVIATNNEGSFTSVVTFELVKQNGKWLIKNYTTDIG